jgi:hypothetical protein
MKISAPMAPSMTKKPAANPTGVRENDACRTFCVSECRVHDGKPGSLSLLEAALFRVSMLNKRIT